MSWLYVSGLDRMENAVEDARAQETVWGQGKYIK
jgi:hypothetical protein